MTSIDEAAIWERALAVPLLRGLDATARAALGAAAVIRRVRAGATVFEEHAGSDTLYVVASGGIDLRCVRRGDEAASVLRRATAGDTLGEEAILGLPRRSSAIAVDDAVVVELPAALFVRGSGRSGAKLVERERRVLERAATADLLRAHVLGRDLGAADLDLAVDAVAWQRFDRGAKIWHQGDPSGFALLVIDGLVALQEEQDGRVLVRAYLGKGDAFGDDEALAQEPRPTDALALGAVSALRMPASALRTLVDRNPGLADAIRRVVGEREARQATVVGAAATRATQHVFRDLYRMQMARSLLVIDQDTCVRCGHCAWSCEHVHGTARLVRRGDKVVTSLPVLGEAPRSLLLPNSCQHCRNAACMVDCPTGAIGRDPEGDVFIREELCTGCGACAKACPWDNIQMAPRPADAPRPKSATSADVAVKCDLCRTYERGPACVAACPTEAITRINPLEDIAELRGLWGSARARPLEGSSPRAPARSAAIPLLGAAVAASSVGGVGMVMHGRDLWSPASGPAWMFGVLTAAAMIGLLAYAAPKRGIARWMKWRPKRKATRPTSMVKPHLDRHLALGIVAVGFGLAHAPVAASASVGRAAQLVFAITVVFGALTWAAYALLPRRLARLERSAALPEDLPQQERALIDRLYREVSGKSDLVKKIFERILLPYAKSPVGPIQLALSGRTLREEERALRARIDGVLEGRGASRLGGIGGLIRIVVELRAIPAQRWLSRALRAGLPLHIVTFAIASILVAVHVVGVLW